MIFFRSDYSQGAHPKVMEALEKTNLEHTDGYGLDPHCENAANMVRELIGCPDANVHMMVGGTPCNITFLAAVLKPYESLISARTGHVYFHETGAAEATGHRVLTVDGVQGKITPEMIDIAFKEYEDEHTPKPGMVYISLPTEMGTIYKKAELEALYAKCKEKDLIFYIDGARLGSALTCKANDISIKDLPKLCDAFYIGGTKNGALFGEVLVILRDDLNDHFRWMIKRQCGLLAKGRLLGVQFEALLEGGEDSVYFQMASQANELAELLREGLAARNISLYSQSETNQVFPLLPAPMVKELAKDFFFYEWAPEEAGMIPIRLVTSWGTKKEDVEAFLDAVDRLSK